MTGVLTIVNIAGAVALLLWAVRMVRTGIERAYGRQLRALLDRTTSRLFAAGAGVALAIGLQGSTAVALLTTSVVAGGLTAPSTGLAVLLGADLGSALVVRLFSLDVTVLVPFLLLTGVVTFMASQLRKVRQAARITIGVALVILSLQLIGTAGAALRDSGFVALATTYMEGEFLTGFLLAALVTWFMHSGVAAVLLLASFVSLGVVAQGPLALALVLGANVGSGIIALVLTRGQDPTGRAVPVANLAVRTILALVCLGALAIPSVAALSDAVDVVTFHVAFNIGVLVLGLPLSGHATRLAEQLLSVSRDPGQGDDEQLQRRPLLDPETVGEPRQAIANALRETLRMSDTVSAMIDEVMDVLSSGDRDEIRQIAALDDEVDHTYTQVKRYLTRIPYEEMSKAEVQRCTQLLTFSMKLEQSADVVVRNLLPLADKRRMREVAFSGSGLQELADLHEQVTANLNFALNVLVSGDGESARSLIERKSLVRDLERATVDGHLERLRKGTMSSVETSEIHLDAVRDLVQINTLVSSIAYPILERRGELLQSRLTEVET